MKIKKLLCLGLVAIMVFGCVGAFAEVINIDDIVVSEKIQIKGNIDFEELGIKGDIQENRVPFYPVAVSLVVYDQNDVIVYREQKNFTSEEFVFEFYLPIAEDCKLKAVLSTAYGVFAEKEFVYTNAAFLDMINSKFKTYTDAERTEFINKNYLKLGIDIDAFRALAGQKMISDAIADAIPYKSITEIQVVFSKNIVVAMLNEKKSKTEIKNYFDNNIGVLAELGVVWNKITNRKTDAEKEEIVETLLNNGKTYSVKTLTDAMKKLMIDDFILNTKYYVDYAKIFTNEENLYELTEEQLDTYKKFSGFKKDVVLKELWNNKGNITSMETLQIAVTNALAVASKAVEGGSEKTTSGGSGGFGGSGFSRPNTQENAPQASMQPNQNERIFSDVPESAWYKTSVEELYKRKIINGKGDGIFDPESNVTREEFAQMLYKLLSVEPQYEKAFTDVSKEAWFYDAVSTLATCGIVNGKGADFGVGENITRQDMAVMLKNTLAYLEVELQYEIKKIPTDLNSVEEYAKESVTLLMSNNILSGYEDGTFGPNYNLTRAEAAQAVYSILKYVEV